MSLVYAHAATTLAATAHAATAHAATTRAATAMPYVHHIHHMQVRAVRLRRDRIVVALEHKVLIYNFADLHLLQSIETLPNPLGLLALSSAAEQNVLASPGLHHGQVCFGVRGGCALLGGAFVGGALVGGAFVGGVPGGSASGGCVMDMFMWSLCTPFSVLHTHGSPHPSPPPPVRFESSCMMCDAPALYRHTHQHWHALH